MEAHNSNDRSVTAKDYLSGKYLTFALATERYGVEILKVEEIIGMVKHTAVPNSPEYLKGVINLRGSLIPIVDLRLRLNIDFRPYDEKTCIIVVSALLNNQNILVGLIVDTVLDVLTLSESDLQPPPQYGVCIDTSFVTAMGRINGNDVILIEVAKILEQSADALTYAVQA